MDVNHSVFQAAQMLNAPLEETDLEKRLGLYQVFSKIYEQNRSLLDEILELENIDSSAGGKMVPRYIVGMVQQGQPYLLTNLLGEQTQNLYQAQCCWLIGRAADAALSFPDRRLSRHHAVIRYCQEDGFYLADLRSTNGSFVNGEAVRYRRRLVEGDRIRVGSLSIQFYASPEAQRLPSVPQEVSELLGLGADENFILFDQPSQAGPEDTQTFMQGSQPSLDFSEQIARHQGK
jgi:pSer/pThr/pTyr-binding forkhead associated (FHA) protein